jgi:hypothetical protein
MTYFNYINENFDRVKKEICMGLISPSTMRYYSIYSRVDYYKKLNNSLRDSVIFTSIDFNIGENWVYKIIQNMERML